MSIPLKTIYSYFQTGDFPTQEQFRESWASFWHKEETNIATVDDYDEQGNISELGNVYTKTQSNDQFMSSGDYTDANGNILAEKIEALGLTTLIEAVENTISEFASHSASYKFENNDFIAIPDNNGNYSLYMFKGGIKTDKTNYLPTGISNVTIGMVEGLQAALNAKMNKPSGNGSFFIRGLGTGPVYASISPATNYLLSWDGNDFKESNVYYNAGKLGVGTASPTEMLHLNNGRVRSKAVVLEENNEVLPGQVTYNNGGFYGTDLTGTRRKLMNQTYADYLALVNVLTDAQKDEIRVKLRKTGETYSIAQPRIDFISPPILENANYVQGIVLRGLNLFLDTTSDTSSYVKLKHLSSGQEFPVSNISVNQNDPTYMSFALNFSTLPLGKYRIIVYNHISGLQNIDTTELDLVNNLAFLPLPTLTWDKITAPGVTAEPSDYTTATGFYINAPNQSYDGNSIAIKSSELLDSTLLSTDFWMTISISQSFISTAYQGGYTVGLITSASPVNLTMGYDFGLSYIPGGAQNFVPTNTAAGNITASTNRLNIIKRGNVITLIYNSNNAFKQTSFIYNNINSLSLAFTLGTLIAPSSYNVDILMKIESLVQL